MIFATWISVVVVISSLLAVVGLLFSWAWWLIAVLLLPALVLGVGVLLFYLAWLASGAH